MTDKELIQKYVPKAKQTDALNRLASGEPIQYIIGNVDFCGNIIKVDNRVLIPRFETETLVAKTIEEIKRMGLKDLKIIDLGTGSGCIAIALKKSLNCEIDAVDISLEALDLAKENAQNNNLEINFYYHDMTKPLNKQYNVIISNPPYLDKDGFIEDIVLKNEPHLALFAPNKGLYFYQQILSYAFNNLTKPGLIALEIGDNEKDLLKGLLDELAIHNYSFQPDLTGLDRYLFIYNE